MMDLLGLGMMGNRESRVVATYEDDTCGLIVDTCAVTDSDQPYETGVKHPGYNDGAWVIVEMYETRERAVMGHERWVARMTDVPMPTELRDVSTAFVAKLLTTLSGSDTWRERGKTA